MRWEFEYIFTSVASFPSVASWTLDILCKVSSTETLGIVSLEGVGSIDWDLTY